MATVNEILADEAIRHAVDLQRYANGAVRRMVAILNAVDRDLMSQLAAALERLDAESFTVERLEQLLSSVRQLNAEAHRRLGRELADEMRELTIYETGYQHQLFVRTLPEPVLASVTVATVSAQQVYAAAMARPFQGRLLSEWAESIGEDQMRRIRDALRMGYVENQTIGQMVTRIRGTRARGYADGILEIKRRHAEAVVRTATSHVAGYARDEFYAANADIIGVVVWVSTLDDRTTAECRLRDGREYTQDTHQPLGHSIPWGAGPGRLHWNCRSTSTAIVKSWSALGIDPESMRPSTRASMDGQVPAEMTYADWLMRQSAERQDDILGPTRGKLLRDGGLTMDRFYNDKGRYLTLDEIRERDAKAFARAGL